MKTYVVGRDNSRIPCDIYTPARESTVSRPHLELTITDDGKYYILDVNSASGTFIMKNRQWQRISQEYVGIDTAVRLGTFETTVRKLLAMKAPEPPKPEEEKPSGEAFFNPETGQIEHE